MMRELAEFLEEHGIDAEIVRRESRTGDLLQAASYGFDRLTTYQIGEFLHKACRVSIAAPHEIHRRLIALGPRCFITTNYDHLIEDSLRRWCPDRYFRVVINRQLTETAEIVQARSLDFVFKLHGDVDDSGSIVLTREQYRALLSDGDLHHALETARILLASRPVVYLGFGLRDPDFLYVRDLLANTYKGGVRDHYALMADVSVAEVDYWRRNYGIHLLSYPTAERIDGSRGHDALIGVLDRLALTSEGFSATVEVHAAPPTDDRLLLDLMRHAGRMSRFDPQPIEFPLRVHRERNRGTEIFTNLDLFDGSPVATFLEEGPSRAVLVGNPGAGKSYALRKSASRVAERLHELCLSESFSAAEIVVPLFVDLKLYRGDLRSLVEASLPAGLSLMDLNSRFRMRIFLDAFNEMPNEYLEQGAWEGDFSSFLSSMSSSAVIISSRTTDLIAKVDLPVFSLDELDRKFVEGELKRAKISVAGKLEDDVLRLLQKPLYFKLAVNQGVALSAEPHPRDIFATLLATLQQDFAERFTASFNLEHALSQAAYYSVDRGEEALPIAELSRLLQDQLQAAGSEIDPENIVNWLVGKNFLLPYSGARVAFFHQSVTEFLAAEELARRYIVSPLILKEKLQWRRWDQTLFLTLSFLPNDWASRFIDEIARIDLTLAMSAARYANSTVDELVQRLLEEVRKRAPAIDAFASRIDWALYSIPVSRRHEGALRAIIQVGNILGGVAAGRLMEICGPKTRDELFELLVSRCDDYNFCIRIRDAIGDTISINDLPTLVGLADQVQSRIASSDDLEHIGFDSAVGEMISQLPVKDVFEAFFDKTKPLSKQQIRLGVIHDALREQQSSEGLAVAATLLANGDDEAVVSISFTARFGEDGAPLDWSSLDTRHVQRCMELLSDERLGNWALDSLAGMCSARNDLRQIVSRAAEPARGIRKACLSFAGGIDGNREVFDALSQLLNMSSTELEAQPMPGLKGLEIDWSGQEDLFLRLLRLRNVSLASNLIESVYSRTPRRRERVWKMNIGPIFWWLDWLQEEHDKHRDDDQWLFQDRLAYSPRRSREAG